MNEMIRLVNPVVNNFWSGGHAPLPHFQKKERWVGALWPQVGWPHIVQQECQRTHRNRDAWAKREEVPQIPLSVNGGGIPLRLAYFSSEWFR